MIALIVAVWLAGSPVYTGGHAPYITRNSNVTVDAVARSLDEARGAQDYLGQLPRVEIMSNRLTSGTALMGAGARSVEPRATYQLVQVRWLDKRGWYHIDTYAYDLSTHLVRFQTGRLTAGPHPNGPCPQ